MPSAPPHNRLIAQAAKEVLAPLGLKRKGTSRIWLDDHGWWLGVVEFQPSSWKRGTKNGSGPASRTSAALTHRGRAALDTYTATLRGLLDGL